MARRTASRMDLRRMAEAAENRAADADVGDDEVKPKKKAAAKAPAKKAAAKRSKEKVVPRRMLMWAVYNGNMKEESRFSFADRNLAEDKLAQLREKSAKKLFFIQPIKVPVGDAAASVSHDDLDSDDEPPKAIKRDEEE